ncbi:terminal organelle protein HMW1 [Mycoplasmoides genitalium]
MAKNKQSVFEEKNYTQTEPENIFGDLYDGKSTVEEDPNIKVAYDADGNGYYIAFNKETGVYYDPYGDTEYDISQLFDENGNPFVFDEKQEENDYLKYVGNPDYGSYDENGEWVWSGYFENDQWISTKESQPTDENYGFDSDLPPEVKQPESVEDNYGFDNDLPPEVKQPESVEDNYGFDNDLPPEVKQPESVVDQPSSDDYFAKQPTDENYGFDNDLPPEVKQPESVVDQPSSDDHFAKQPESTTDSYSFDSDLPQPTLDQPSLDDHVQYNFDHHEELKPVAEEQNNYQVGFDQVQANLDNNEEIQPTAEKKVTTDFESKQAQVVDSYQLPIDTDQQDQTTFSSSFETQPTVEQFDQVNSEVNDQFKPEITKEPVLESSFNKQDVVETSDLNSESNLYSENNKDATNNDSLNSEFIQLNSNSETASDDVHYESKSEPIHDYKFGSDLSQSNSNNSLESEPVKFNSETAPDAHFESQSEPVDQVQYDIYQNEELKPTLDQPSSDDYFAKQPTDENYGFDNDLPPEVKQPESVVDQPSSDDHFAKQPESTTDSYSFDSDLPQPTLDQPSLDDHVQYNFDHHEELKPVAEEQNNYQVGFDQVQANLDNNEEIQPTAEKKVTTDFESKQAQVVDSYQLPIDTDQQDQTTFSSSFETQPTVEQFDQVNSEVNDQFKPEITKEPVLESSFNKQDVVETSNYTNNLQKFDIQSDNKITITTKKSSPQIPTTLPISFVSNRIEYKPVETLALDNKESQQEQITINSITEDSKTLAKTLSVQLQQINSLNNQSIVTSESVRLDKKDDQLTINTVNSEDQQPKIEVFVKAKEPVEEHSITQNKQSVEDKSELDNFNKKSDLYKIISELKRGELNPTINFDAIFQMNDYQMSVKQSFIHLNDFVTNYKNQISERYLIIKKELQSELSRLIDQNENLNVQFNNAKNLTTLQKEEMIRSLASDFAIAYKPSNSYEQLQKSGEIMRHVQRAITENEKKIESIQGSLKQLKTVYNSCCETIMNNINKLDNTLRFAKKEKDPLLLSNFDSVTDNGLVEPNQLMDDLIDFSNTFDNISNEQLDDFIYENMDRNIDFEFEGFSNDFVDIDAKVMDSMSAFSVNDLDIETLVPDRTSNFSSLLDEDLFESSGDFSLDY